MKLSLKFREETQHQNPLLRAKIPVTILGFPFLSGVVAGDSSDLAFSLRSNFSTGPSLSLSYHPTLPSNYPFAVTLKSGIGLFGSPHNSPLTFTANFNLFSSSSSSSNPNLNSLCPTFSLQVKPQFGNFSLFKSVSSTDGGAIRVDGLPQNGDLANGSVPDFGIVNGLGHGSGGPEKGLSWRDLKRESARSGFLSGIFVAARTSMPVTNRAVVNFRWGVDFPAENGGVGSKTQLPVLVVNKISLERVEEVKKVEEKKIDEAKRGDVELLKGMCSWMRREVEDLQRENREIKHVMESMKLNVPASRRSRGDQREVAGKRGMTLPAAESSSEFERWRSKRGSGSAGVEENVHKDPKMSSNRMSEVENELQKAIKAASS